MLRHVSKLARIRLLARKPLAEDLLAMMMIVATMTTAAAVAPLALLPALNAVAIAVLMQALPPAEDVNLTEGID